MGPSEFGGERGLVQKPPHEPTAAETARLMRATNPNDLSDTPEAALIREWEREGRGAGT